jgi:flavin-dependent dehydrogenase
VHPAGQPLRGIRYLDGRRVAEARFPADEGRGVRRTTLHAALAAAAEQRGVTVLPQALTGVSQDEHAVTVSVRPTPSNPVATVRARYLIGADGLHSKVRTLSGLGRLDADRASTRWGLRRHYRLAPWSDLVEVHWASGAEAYVTPVAEDVVGVAILSGQRWSFDELLAQFPALRSQLSLTPGSAVRGAGPLRQRTARRSQGRTLLVGDAAGYVDALTGEGIAVGLAAAATLVDCLARDQPEAYEREWRRVSRRSRVLTEGLLWTAGRPRLRRVIVPAAERAPWAFGRLVAQLAR